MRKMDEMEMSIALQSFRYAYAAGTILLGIYNIYYLIINKNIHLSTLIILNVMLLIQQGIYSYKLENITSGKGLKKLISIMIIVIAVVIIILLVGKNI
ncbi:MAG: hypothetical protein WBH68_06280 [Erysipelotrichaceae bacterium]|nr:hypothetical protein [Bacillota bacterium]NLP21407.1 hypothetical protein [Erysipelotrichaceae bacterium]